MRLKMLVVACCALAAVGASVVSAASRAQAAVASFTSPTTSFVANSPVPVSSVTPCPLGTGAATIHLQITNQKGTQVYSQHVAAVKPDGSWATDIQAPIVGDAVSNVVDATCYLATTSTLTYQGNALQLHGGNTDTIPKGTVSSPDTVPAGSTFTVTGTPCPTPSPDLLNVTRAGAVWIYDDLTQIVTNTGGSIDVKPDGTWTAQATAPAGPVVRGTTKDYNFRLTASCAYQAPDGQTPAMYYAFNNFTLTDPPAPAHTPAVTDPSPGSPSGASAAPASTGQPWTAAASSGPTPSGVATSGNTAPSTASPQLASTGKAVGLPLTLGLMALLGGYLVALRARERFTSSPDDILPRRRLARWRI